MKFPKPKLISFREEVKEIEKSTYLTHSLYYHPAKFIPQIVRFCLDKYCMKGGIILDPFAGGGTTGVESSLNGYKTYLLDINPLLDLFYNLKIHSFSEKEWDKIYLKSKVTLDNILTNKPKKVNIINNNISYWYPDKLLKHFSRLWTNYYEIDKKTDTIVKNVVILVLFRLSKFYSFAEHSMPKLFISKRKRNFIEKILLDESLLEQIEKKSFTILDEIGKSVSSLIGINGEMGEVEYFVGEDSSEFNFDKLSQLDCIITSPPYLQAQEYIRTFQLEMMWKGYSQDEIRYYKSKEIPFRKFPIRIDGNYINRIRGKIEKKNLLKLFDSYFYHTIKTLENSSKRLKKNGKLCVLIGNPKMEGNEVEIWKVILEYFVEKLGFKVTDIYEDKIKMRKLFKGRNNLNPDGMKSEYLLVLEK